MKSTEKTFITDVLFIDRVQTQFIPKNDQFRIRAHCDGPIVLLTDGHASHITPRIVAYADSQPIILIKLVAHSSHISQPLDLCAFSLFKILYEKEQKRTDCKKKD
jgi:hypothetical protein